METEKNLKDLTTRECADKIKKSIKTINHWINYGYGKQKIKLAFTRRIGRTYLINRSTFEVFLWKIAKIYTEGPDQEQSQEQAA